MNAILSNRALGAQAIEAEIQFLTEQSFRLEVEVNAALGRVLKAQSELSNIIDQRDLLDSKKKTLLQAFVIITQGV